MKPNLERSLILSENILSVIIDIVLFLLYRNNQLKLIGIILFIEHNSVAITQIVNVEMHVFIYKWC